MDRILGVDYERRRFCGGDELYLTRFGLPYADLLDPANHFTDKDWFRGHSQRLPGTSCLFRITTKAVAGRDRQIVLKWSRVGQDVVNDGDDKLVDATFNSPFEEFALVMELRDAVQGSAPRFGVQKPLAVYVPNQRLEPWRIGRHEHLMLAKMKELAGFHLDLDRPYAVIYEWIKGLDAAQAFQAGLLAEEEVRALTAEAIARLAGLGFVVRDNKPQHVIVRPLPEGGLLRGRDGRPAWAAIDFELLERTPERETLRRGTKRRAYLAKQRDRFSASPAAMPGNLGLLRVLDVDYVWGRAGSTGGQLYVAGRDPELFDYFLPERWELTPRVRLSSYRESYYTTSKDDIRLVWKVCRVNSKPDADPYSEEEKRLLDHGHNSPFEEFALAMELARLGIPTIYPRAVYMAGEECPATDEWADLRRVASHAALLGPDGPVLRADRRYISIWGYFNGPDERLAARDAGHWQSINALRALRDGYLAEAEYLALLHRFRRQLSSLGFEDLYLRGHHLLLALDGDGGGLVRDAQGHPEPRLCNFDFLWRRANHDRAPRPYRPEDARIVLAPGSAGG